MLFIHVIATPVFSITRSFRNHSNMLFMNLLLLLTIFFFLLTIFVGSQELYFKLKSLVTL